MSSLRLTTIPINNNGNVVMMNAINCIEEKDKSIICPAYASCEDMVS
jgi:hypothetical protein